METKKTQKRFLALKLASGIFMTLAILAFCLFASEIAGVMNFMKFFGLKFLMLGICLSFGWLGTELSEAAEEINKAWLRARREEIAVLDRSPSPVR